MALFELCKQFIIFFLVEAQFKPLQFCKRTDKYNREIHFADLKVLNTMCVIDLKRAESTLIHNIKTCILNYQTLYVPIVYLDQIIYDKLLFYAV